MGILVSVLGPRLDLGLGAGEGEYTDRFGRGSASLLRLGEGSRYLVLTHLCQKLQDGSSPLCEHINQGLDEAGALFVMSVCDVP